MSILAIESHAQARDVSFTDDSISVDLLDGHTISTPLTWSPGFLRQTTPSEKIGN